MRLSSIICERDFDFAVRMIRLCERLCEQGTIGGDLANQLLKAGTSIAANAEGAQEGQTKPDFIAKDGGLLQGRPKQAAGFD